MSDSLFNIVFYGTILPGKDQETAMRNMAALFKTEPARVKAYFSGERKVIKSSVDKQTAAKYRAALGNAGLVIKIEPADASQKTAATAKKSPRKAAHKPDPASPAIDTSGITLAAVGADVLENPIPVEAAPVGDISDISMAEVGADVLKNPPVVKPTAIGDISDISMAEVGADVLENPVVVKPTPIGDISDISLAEAGADLIEHPRRKKKAPIPDISGLSLK